MILIITSYCSMKGERMMQYTKLGNSGLECIPHLYGLYGIRRRCERAAYMDDR